MANKRDTSKQKRARQNRAQRAALDARTKAASEPPADRRAKAAPSSAEDAGTPKKGGFFSGGQPRAPRPGDTPVDLDTLEGTWLSKRMQVPGGRQILFGALLTGLLTVTMSVVHQYPATKADQEKRHFTQTVFDHYGSGAALALAIPLVIAAVALTFTLSARRRVIWQVCAYTMAVLVLLRGDLYANYLLVVAFYGYGIWRAAKVEGPRPGSLGARTAARRAGVADRSPEPGDSDDAED